MKLEYFINKEIFINNFIFNPSIIFDLGDNKYSNKINLYDSCNFVLSYRSSNRIMGGNSFICIKKNNNIKYDEKNNIIKIEFSELNDFFGEINENLEDARFSIIKNKLYILYGVFNGNNGYSVSQYLSPFDDENNKIAILKNIPLKRIEKNWIIFNKTNHNSTFIIYEFYPEYIVYELDENNNLTKIKSTIFPKKINGILRGGCYPIEIDKYLYFFGHNRISANNYKLSLIVLSVDSLDIVGFSLNLLDNNIFIDDKKKIPNIVYCRGSVYIENLKTFIISIGIDDKEIKLINLNLDEVNSKLDYNF